MAVLTTTFIDTSVLLGGLIQFGPKSEAAQRLMAALADDRFDHATTAWHCCLEFYSVATRLPAEYRLKPADALKLLEVDVFRHVTVHGLPERQRLALLRTAVQDGVAGGRIYDSHIAEIARGAGAQVVVTENRRHFVSLARHGISMLTAAECLTRLNRSS